MGFETSGRTGRSGVTLFELLIVLTVIGGLAAVYGGGLISGQTGYFRARAGIEALEAQVARARTLAAAVADPAVRFGVAVIKCNAGARPPGWYSVLYRAGGTGSPGATGRMPARPAAGALEAQPADVAGASRFLGMGIVPVAKQAASAPELAGTLYLEFDGRGWLASDAASRGLMTLEGNHDPSPADDSYTLDLVEQSGYMRLRVSNSGAVMLSGWTPPGEAPSTGAGAF